MTDPFKQVTEMVGSGPYRYKTDERVAGALVVDERANKAYQPRVAMALPTAPPVRKSRISIGSSGGSFRMPPRDRRRPANRRESVSAADPRQPICCPSYATRSHGRDHGADRLSSPPRCGFQPSDPPIQQPRALRRALFGAIDQGQFMAAMMGSDTPLWEEPVGFLPPTSPLASDAGMSALTSPRDDAAVKRALAAAGATRVIQSCLWLQPICRF